MSLKERIIDETTKMFVTYGIKSIRMDDIATNLGVSKRTIYEVFGDKESLITDCIQHYCKGLELKKAQVLSKATNVIEEFLLLFEDWETNAEEHYKLMSNIRKFYPNIYERISRENSEKGYEILRKKMQAGVEDGYLLCDINYDLAIAVFSHSIFGIMFRQNMILPSNVSEIDAFKYVITYFIRGVATEKGIRLIDDYIGGKKKV